jgi:hypothetical protein
MSRSDFERRLRSLVQIRKMHGERLGYVIEVCGMPMGGHGWELKGARQVKQAWIAAMVASLYPEG